MASPYRLPGSLGAPTRSPRKHCRTRANTPEPCATNTGTFFGETPPPPRSHGVIEPPPEDTRVRGFSGGADGVVRHPLSRSPRSSTLRHVRRPGRLPEGDSTGSGVAGTRGRSRGLLVRGGLGSGRTPPPKGAHASGLATYPTGPLPSGPSAAQAEDQLVDPSGTGSGSSRRPEPGLARRESGAAGSSPQDRVSACGRVPRPGVGISVRAGPRRAASGQRRGCPRRRRGPPAPPGGWRVRSRRPGAPPGPSSGPRGSRRSPSPCRADR